MNEHSSPAINALVLWTYSPDGISLPGILASMTEADLVIVMIQMKGAVGRIAWAEYGRRRGFFDFELKTVVVEGQVRVTFEAEGRPIQESATFEVKA